MHVCMNQIEIYLKKNEITENDTYFNKNIFQNNETNK